MVKPFTTRPARRRAEPSVGHDAGLSLPRAILSRRLGRLVREGLMERVAYAERRRRCEYRLTPMARGRFDVLAAMWRWGYAPGPRVDS